MIKWKEINGLHVVSKFEQILSKWFGVEQIFADHCSKIQGPHLDADYTFKNLLMKLQIMAPHGYPLLGQDIERVTEAIFQSSSSTCTFDAHLPHVKGVCSKIVFEGENLGLAMAYPFLLDNVTEEDERKLMAQLQEMGIQPQDATKAVEGLKRMSARDLEYLTELMELLAQEVVDFHREISKREERIDELNSKLGEKYRFHLMIGKSKKMQQIYRLLEKVSKTDSSVFIQGENGTGKELVAKAIHYYSGRKEAPFLAVNCSAFNENLLDSELFGHVKGAFTGAIKDKKGLFESANGGTLFLDEIGDTDPSMQVKLLRVLQEGTYLPVGATTPQRCDVRIIAATNRNIKEMMAKGEFREDLYYRINVINILLPPLRERREDIAILIEHFLKKRCDESGLPLKSFSKKCLEKLLDYAWPGNVRELENEIERVVVLAAEEKTILPELLSQRIFDFGETGPTVGQGINTSGTLKQALEELERLMIREGLKRCNFNKSKLAKELGISRASLIMKVDKYSLDKRKIRPQEEAS